MRLLVREEVLTIRGAGRCAPLSPELTDIAVTPARIQQTLRCILLLRALLIHHLKDGRP